MSESNGRDADPYFGEHITRARRGPDGPPACTNCTRYADLHFNGLEGFHICSRCAITVLPELIAQAVRLGVVKAGDAEASLDEARHAWAEAEQHYWRAMFLRAQQQNVRHAEKRHAERQASDANRPGRSV